MACGFVSDFVEQARQSLDQACQSEGGFLTFSVVF